ncbi:radical SAM/SPASM domain-containing protein [Agrobacterium fabrum]|uniref:Radical SAM additional 4Fe4S-binding SPASM domain-containing protein n=1 Tax=Agrobacterium fabrum TaxID=1176649 RepID=A0A7Z7BQU3_9HYPH|nr:radical SAM protein [Agrobacterium fabrum]MCR6727079.1 radical SAM protein [Agrobacterium fabrum]SDK02984.1 radical SAM additional 4Fe4S-binding SPASM domain-containing protein [Agrobacterium fabrum]
MAMAISLDPRFRKLALSAKDKDIYLDKYSGEWFAAPINSEELLNRLGGGLELSEVSNLSDAGLRLVSRLATDGLLTGTHVVKPSPCASPSRHQVTLVIIEASNFCNLSCSYCFEDVPTRGQKMTFETADAIVDSLQQLNLAASFVVEFNGGESFINFAVMQRIVERVETAPSLRNYCVSFGVTTNLTMLSREMIDFIKEHRISVSVSLDGIREDHDRHRVFANGRGSHAQVMRNMERLIQHGVEFSTVSVVSTPGQLTRAYALLKERRIPYISFAIRRHSERAPLAPVDYKEIARELADAFIDSLTCFKAKQFAPKVMDAVIMIRNLIKPYAPDYMCLRTPCGAGINMITYDTSGDIYACQDLIKEPLFKVGSAGDDDPQALIDGSDVVQRLRARRPGENDGCGECDYQMFCQGGCFSTSYYAAGKQFEASLSTRTPHCEFYYASFSRLFPILADEGPAMLAYLESIPYLVE